jgi:hypothetical protein
LESLFLPVGLFTFEAHSGHVSTASSVNLKGVLLRLKPWKPLNFNMNLCQWQPRTLPTEEPLVLSTTTATQQPFATGWQAELH